MTTLALTIPIFSYIFIGWLAAKLNYVSDKVCDGLSEYVFSIALPVLIIMTLTQANSKDPIMPTYWIAYFGACAIVWLGCMLFIRKLFKRSHKESVLCGFASSQANTMFMGVPLILEVYGKAGSVPLFMLLAIHLPIMLGAATFLIELGGEESFWQRLKKIGRILLKNPIFIALIIGLILHELSITPKGSAASVLQGISGTASACALLSLGMSMKRYRIRDDLKVSVLITFGKLVIHPLLVWVLGFYVFHLPTVYAGVAVLFACMPVGINSYLLAVRYGTAEGQISSSVVLSTFLSVITVSIWLGLLLTIK